MGTGRTDEFRKDAVQIALTSGLSRRQEFIVAEDFLDAAPRAAVLGNNIFFGHGLPQVVATADEQTHGATVFRYNVPVPERYGIVDFDVDGHVQSIVEKPAVPPSNYAVMRLYFVDRTASERAKSAKPFACGELKIT